MPFVEQAPKAFTKPSIESLNAGQIGVYGLFKADRWVYVGSGDIRQRLLDHHGGDNVCINQEQPTHWVAEVVAGYVDREKALIVELQPACNKRVG